MVIIHIKRGTLNIVFRFGGLQENIELLEEVQRRVPKMAKGLEKKNIMSSRSGSWRGVLFFLKKRCWKEGKTSSFFMNNWKEVVAR